MALKKPSDIFGDKKSEESNLPIIESGDTFREELNKVESLSQQILELQQELSQKVIKNDLESLVLSQINEMKDNFEYLQNNLKKTNQKDINQIREVVSEFESVVINLVEEEIPKYKKQITKTELGIDNKFNNFKEEVKDIEKELDNKLLNVLGVIDENLEVFNNEIQETKEEVLNTSKTYQKLYSILENKTLKENEKLEKYSEILNEFGEKIDNFCNQIQEKNSAFDSSIEEKIEEYKTQVDQTQNTFVFSIDDKIEDYKSQINESQNNFISVVDDKIEKQQKQINDVKADVVINEKHIKSVDKYFQEHHQDIIELKEEVFSEIKNQRKEINEQQIKNVDRYLQEHHQDIIELKEEVFSEIEKLPIGNLQENLERLEKKIDFIKETYSRIEPEVIAKEVIQEGLLNEPSDTKNSDPLTPLKQNFVTLDQLQEHYRLFINRIQQQLSTLGGGGETRLKYLDDIVGIATNASAYDGKFLKYDHSIGKFVFDTAGGGAGSQTLDDTLNLGNTSSLGMSVGVVTATQLNVTGVSTFQNSVKIETAGSLSLGDNSEFQIYYSGSNSIIRDNGLGDLYLAASPAVRITNTNFNKTSAVFNDGGAAELYYNNSKTFETTGAGATVFGTLQSQQLRVSGVSTLGISTFTGNVSFGSSAFFGDSKNLNFGNSNNLQLYYDGANSYVDSSNSGLIINGSSITYSSNTHSFQNASKTTTFAAFLSSGTAFYNNNNTKLQIIGAGITVTGTTFTNQLSSSGIVTASSFRPSSGYIQAADGTNSFYIYSGTGDVAFQGKINTSQINTASGYKALDFGTTTTPSVNITNSLNVGSGVSVVGVVTASSFSGNASSATYATTAGIATYASTAGIATYATSSGIATYSTSSGIATYASTAGIATYATTAGVSTSVIGGISSITQEYVTGIATFANGPVFIGAATSTGTASQRLQVTGGGYFSGNVGIGTTLSDQALSVLPKLQILNNSNADGRIILRAKPGNSYRWNIDNDGGTNNLRFFKEDDATGANGAAPFQITPTGNATLTGNLNAAGNYFVKVARTSNQTITAGGDTLIGFSTISDSNGWFNASNNRITPTVAGNYVVTGMVNWNAGSITNNQTNIQLRKNTVTFALSQVGIQTFAYTMFASGIVTLNGSTDYIDFTVYTSNPTSQVITGTADGSWTKLDMYKIN